MIIDQAEPAVIVQAAEPAVQNYSATKNEELSLIIASFVVGQCPTEFIMQFLDAGYGINPSEANDIKKAAIARIRHVFPEHLQDSRMIRLIIKFISDCYIDVVRIIFQLPCNTPAGRYKEKCGFEGEVSLMEGLNNISVEIKRCCVSVRVADAIADCLQEQAVFINVHETCELASNSTNCLPCKEEEGALLANAYNIVAAVYLLLDGTLSIVNLGGKLDERRTAMCHIFSHIKEEWFTHVEKETTHIKYLAMHNMHHTKEENIARNFQWVSSICNGIGKPEILDALCMDSRLPFLYNPGENGWTGTDDAWAQKAVGDIDQAELIANLQKATWNDAFRYLNVHLSGFPTNVKRVRVIRDAILAKLNVSFLGAANMNLAEVCEAGRETQDAIRRDVRENGDDTDVDNIAWVDAQNMHIAEVSEAGRETMQGYHREFARLDNEAAPEVLNFCEQQQAGNRASKQESFDNADRVADAIIAAYEDDGIKLYFGRDKYNFAATNGEHIRHAKGTTAQFENEKNGKSKEGCVFSAHDAVAIRNFSRCSRKLWERIRTNIKQRIPHCSFKESENTEYPSDQI
jgi:hypothetical protein